MMLVCQLGGFGTTRVQHHQFAPAALQRFKAIFHVGDGHDGTVGNQWVAANDHEVIGTVDIRNREQGLVAKQLVSSKLMGQLVR